MNDRQQFIALILGFGLWAVLGYLGKVPLDPLIALMQMGLGGLITHMLKGGTGGVQTPAPAAQGGFISLRLLAIIGCIALGLSMLAGCSTVMRGYEAAAVNEIKQVDDHSVAVWKQWLCAIPVGAIMRSPDTIEAVNKYCGGGQQQLGGGQQPITINLTVPAAAAPASAAK